MSPHLNLNAGGNKKKMLAREKILISVTVLLVILLVGITVTYAAPMSLSMDALRRGYHIEPIGRYNGYVEAISIIDVSCSTNDNATHGETLTTNVSVLFECSSNITVEIVPIGIDELNKWVNLTYSDLPFIPYSEINEIKTEWVLVEPESVLY